MSNPLGPMARSPAPARKASGSVGDGNLAEAIPMEDFFEGIAAIYDLAPRTATARAPSKAAGNPSPIVPARRRNRARHLLAVTICAIGVWLGVGYLRHPAPVVPLALRGSWSTNAPRYEDRGFWISAGQVGFRNGPNPDDVMVYDLDKVTQRPGTGNTIRYTMNYTADGGLVTWDFEYVRDPRPIIRFANQKSLAWSLNDAGTGR